MINVFQPSLGPAEAEAAAATMATDWIGKGPKVADLERVWAGHLKVPPGNVRSTTSATEGLFQLMPLLGISPPDESLNHIDEVIMPAISFVGAANAVLAAGGVPIFCDVDPRTLNPTLETIVPHITRHTKAIMVLHYGGVPADIEREVRPALAYAYHQYDIWPALIEDCAVAPLSAVGGQRCGTFGEAAVWSFDAMKMLSAGDGGLVYFEDEANAYRFSRATQLGTSEPSGLASKNERWWEFDVHRAGRKATMNDLTASIILAQLDKARDFLARRLAIHWRYDRQLAGLDWLELPPYFDESDIKSSRSFYWVQTKHRDRLAKYLRDHDIYTTFRYWPLNQLSYYGVQPACPQALWAAANTLLLPLHQGLTDQDVDKVCEVVHEFGKVL